MADQEKPMDVQLLKRTRISVYVDEALPDILVVTYEFGVKIFKGVLLNSTKRNLPCGVPALHPAFSISPSKSNADEDILYSVNQRYAYTDPHHAKTKNVRMPSKYKNNKMTVRLRPRQVLCSKCKGICNENSENVSKKRKSTDGAPPPAKRGANAPVTRSVYSEQVNKRKAEIRLQPSLIPKVSRLLPQDISNAINGSVNKLSKEDGDTTKKNFGTENTDSVKDIEHLTDHSIQHSDSSNGSQGLSESEVPSEGVQEPEIHAKSVKRTLRKKRSIGSMEDLWDESVFEEGGHAKNSNAIMNSALVEQTPNVGSTCINTRTIKISYGPQGEGTVLKIPAKIENLNVSDDSEENINVDDQPQNKDVDNKAARKALKRAKKKARHKILFSGNSPSYLSGASPRYSIGGSSPRYIIGSGSPRHILGNNSPRYVTSSTNDLHVPKKHKHKMKRKKRHREDKDRKHKENEVSSASESTTRENVTQKLSINLKKLNNTYTSCQSASDKGEENTSSSDEHSEQVPDFPPSNPPLIMRVNAQTVSSAIGADGGRVVAGDVVWGKLHGFPWWPGKVLTISSGSQGPQAHVVWYGSSTSSLIQCDQLSSYLENFKMRYNKKKRGAYKEAVRQATTEAKENAENCLRRDTQIVSSPAHSIMTVPTPALASPREIDVMS